MQCFSMVQSFSMVPSWFILVNAQQWLSIILELRDPELRESRLLTSHERVRTIRWFSSLIFRPDFHGPENDKISSCAYPRGPISPKLPPVCPPSCQVIQQMESQYRWITVHVSQSKSRCSKFYDSVHVIHSPCSERWQNRKGFNKEWNDFSSPTHNVLFVWGGPDWRKIGKFVYSSFWAVRNKRERWK